MNERIKELAKQATTITYEDDGWRLYGTEVVTFNKQKFAELIVKGCARVANDSNQSKNRAVGVSVGDVVREHFGVEE